VQGHSHRTVARKTKLLLDDNYTNKAEIIDRKRAFSPFHFAPFPQNVTIGRISYS
jgi:hypothetical protein